MFFVRVLFPLPSLFPPLFPLFLSSTLVSILVSAFSNEISPAFNCLRLLQSKWTHVPFSDTSHHVSMGNWFLGLGNLILYNQLIYWSLRKFTSHFYEQLVRWSRKPLVFMEGWFVSLWKFTSRFYRQLVCWSRKHVFIEGWFVCLSKFTSHFYGQLVHWSRKHHVFISRWFVCLWETGLLVSESHHVFCRHTFAKFCPWHTVGISISQGIYSPWTASTTKTTSTTTTTRKTMIEVTQASNGNNNSN